MNSKALSMVSILAGIAVGLASTYPIQLSMVPSLILWALAGIILGLFAATTNDMVRGGILYGVFLAISFLFSRFGGTADQMGRYSSLVAVACIPAVICGTIALYLGSRLRRLLNRPSSTIKQKHGSS
jgi:hypothetical protein